MPSGTEPEAPGDSEPAAPGGAQPKTHSGMAVIVGRPNVGKSSLLNALMRRKVSIVTPRPQTTRHRIHGVVQQGDAQIVFVDTPGLHDRGKFALNKHLNEVAAGSISGVDVALFVVEAGRWTEEDDAVLARLHKLSIPVGLVVNKIDKVKDRSVLLPELDALARRRDFAFIIPLSALKRQNLDPLLTELAKRMPEGPPLFPAGQTVGHDLAFMASELVREQLMLRLREELPYALTVQIEKLELDGAMWRINAVVWVERESQKKIVIGAGGESMKAIATSARKALERETAAKVFLQVWVRVKEGWTDDPAALRQLGYSSE